MSWDGYLDNLIAQSNDSSGSAHIDRACIIGRDNGSPWTTEGHACGLKISSAEGEVLANCLKSKDYTPLQANGFKINNKKFQFLRVEDDKLILGKMKNEGSVSIQASKTAIVIAHCPEGGQQGQANKAVGVIAEYLESLNY